MTNQKFYLITGLFFQEDTALGIGMDPQIGERATIQKVIKHALFSGVIDTQSNVGALQDHYGTSNLIIKELKDDSIEFIKTYDRQGHSFTYHFFKNDDGEYIGYWENKKMKMRGLARCTIKGIDPTEFFQYKDIPEKLKKFTSKHLEEFED
ncbi:MAG TPA: hypothetical protein PK886_00905 [Candidatus Paceibacterota bacterium]|nr:hypothetical protein [Candidatus Paceibacterota bacterium]